MIENHTTISVNFKPFTPLDLFSLHIAAFLQLLPGQCQILLTKRRSLHAGTTSIAV